MNLLVLDPYLNQAETSCFSQLKAWFPGNCTYHSPNHDTTILPDGHYDAIIVFGSGHMVTQKEPWMDELARTLHQKLRAECPVLGICFGHQLMGQYFGCQIKTLSQKCTGGRLIQGLGKLSSKKWIIPVAHQQVLSTLGPSCLELGHSAELPHEIIAHKTLPYLGIQGHPEASSDFLERECRQKSLDHDGKKFLQLWASFFS